MASASTVISNTVLSFPAASHVSEHCLFYLCLGDTATNESDAVSAYRRGREVVEEPDLESRLLCALAGRLSAVDVERKELVQRALGLKGSLVAMATARLMGLQ